MTEPKELLHAKVELAFEMLGNISIQLQSLRDDFRTHLGIHKRSPIQTGEMITIDEFCNYLNISRTTFHKWDRDGKVSTRKIGRQVYISREELDRFLYAKSTKKTEK